MVVLISLLLLAGDGVFSVSDGAFISLVDLKSNTTTNLISTLDVKDVSNSIHGTDSRRFSIYPQESGKPLFIQEWKLSDDLKYLLVKTDYRKVSSTTRQLRREFITYYISNGDGLVIITITYTILRRKLPTQLYPLPIHQ